MLNNDTEDWFLEEMTWFQESRDISAKSDQGDISASLVQTPGCLSGAGGKSVPWQHWQDPALGTCFHGTKPASQGKHPAVCKRDRPACGTMTSGKSLKVCVLLAWKVVSTPLENPSDLEPLRIHLRLPEYVFLQLACSPLVTEKAHARWFGGWKRMDHRGFCPGYSDSYYLRSFNSVNWVRYFWGDGIGCWRKELETKKV